MQLSRFSKKQAFGISLIEVMVAVVLLSGAVLAMAAMHANSMKYTKMAQFRGIATQLAIEVGDRMRANTAAAAGNAYALSNTYDAEAAAVTVPSCTIVTNCTAAEIAAIDLAEMQNAIRVSLPGGDLQITQDAGSANVFNIWVIWLDPEAFGSDADSSAAALACPFTATPQPQCLPMRVAL